jgi:hypothetical protein
MILPKDNVHYVIFKENNLYYSCHKNGFLEGYEAATRFRLEGDVRAFVRTFKITDGKIGRVSIKTILEEI